jgi:deoxyribodipyrimidine photo-lyase
MVALSIFPPSRQAGLEHLAAFVPKAGRAYATGRNFDHGPQRHDAVSRLSPYLRRRMVTETEVLEAVLGRHTPLASEKFVQEVFWRTYWKGWLELRPDVWLRYQTRLRAQVDALQTQGGLRDRWEAACTGKTEIECFNYWAHELVSTGYLHNHARMWFASVWIFTLRLPWELGADFFLRHLLDGDPASNTLSWRWVAGIQTPGKTYLARPANIAKYTDGRFAQTTGLASQASPIAAEPPGPPQPLAQHRPPDPTRRCGFLLHCDDLSPGFALKGLAPVSCCLLLPEAGLTPFQMAPHVKEFDRRAANETLSRWSDRTGPLAATAEKSDQVLDWAKATGVEQIVTAYAPVGPVADQVRSLQRLPGAPEVIFVRRAYDTAAWPHATNGFFKFKARIPALLNDLI